MQKYLTQRSIAKIKELELGSKQVPSFIKDLRNLFMESAKNELNMTQSENIPGIKEVFLDLDRNMNETTKLTHDIQSMNKTCSISVNINSHNILMHFLYNDKSDVSVIAALINALNLFCHSFPADYDGTTVYACLDNNTRDVCHGCSITDMQKKSMAFTSSGMTDGKNKMIVLTKQEEIIRLLFHEMIHLYFILTAKSFHGKIMIQKPWNIDASNLIAEECVAEFIGVIMNSVYSSMYFSDNTMLGQIIDWEVQHSLMLTARVLKFFGYNSSNYESFFTTKSKPIKSPIYIWEYVFLRSMLMLQMNEIDNIMIGPGVTSLLNDDSILITAIKPYMDNTIVDNISYAAMDVDWTKIV